MKKILRWLFEFNTYYRNEWIKKEAQKIPSGSVILDAGAGRGIYRKFFSHCIYKAQDFALEPGTIGHYTKLDYVCDITKIPENDCTFDVIICTEVLEHVPYPHDAIRELHRLLKPGGTLLLSAPQACRIHQEPYHFYGGFTPYWFKKILSEIGFEIEEISPNRGFFSLFGQEAQFFSYLLDPRKSHVTKYKFLLGLLWFITLPIFRILLPCLCYWLDNIQPNYSTTVGYHVRAKKRF